MNPSAIFAAVLVIVALATKFGAMIGAMSGNVPANPAVTAYSQTIDSYQTNFTSTAAITLPQPGLHLGFVQLEATTKPGDFALTYDGVSVAHFPCASDGTDGAAGWLCDYTCSSTISSTIQAINGSVGAVYLSFFSGSIGGPPIAAYRAISQATTFSSSHSSLTALTAVNFDAAPNVPKSLLAFCTVAGSTIYFQARGPLQAGYNAQAQIHSTMGGAFIMPAPPLQAANSLTLYYTNTASAGTFTWWAFY